MYYVVFDNYEYAKWIMDENEFERSFPNRTSNNFSWTSVETLEEAEKLEDETNNKMRKYYGHS